MKKFKSFLKEYPLETIILAVAIILMILNPSKTLFGLSYALKTYLNLLPIIISVAFLMGFISEFLNKKTVSELIGRETGMKGVMIGAIFGTLMIGPSFIFYPLFKELREKGAGVNVIATTIGAWSIKLQWLPFAIPFLGLKFILLFDALILIFAILSGFVVSLFVKS